MYVFPLLAVRRAAATPACTLAAGSGKGNVRVLLLPPLLPGDLAFPPDCGLSSPRVKVPFPKVACIAASR